jgi:hypothetical protein
MSQVKKLLLAGALALAASTAQAGPWWGVGPNSKCAPVASSPFASAEQMRQRGWSDAAVVAYGSTYAVQHAGIFGTELKGFAPPFHVGKPIARRVRVSGRFP